MKVLIFNSLYYPYKVGGAEVSVQLLAEELVKLGHQVRVVSLTEGKTRATKKINNVEVVYLPLINIYWPFSNQKIAKIKKIFWHILDSYNPFMRLSAMQEIKEFNPDVIHTNNLSGFSVSVWSAARKLNLKIIHTSRDYYLFHPSSTLFKNGMIMDPMSRSVKLWSLVKKYHSRKVDKYVGISSFIKDLHVEHDFFKNAERHVIYNSVNKILDGVMNKSLNRVGFIGRLSIEKGFDDFCSLANKYKNSGQFEFFAAGNYVNNGSLDALQKKAIEANVQVMGFIALKDFLESVDIVVLPIKWNEPFGRTVVECALSGKLVFTTPVGSMVELSYIIPSVIVTRNIEIDFEQKVNNHSYQNIEEKVFEIFKSTTIAKNYLELYK